MAVTYDAHASGISGAAPTTLPWTKTWGHTSASTSNPSPGIAVWVLLYKDGQDILTGSFRSCTCGGVAMQSQGYISLRDGQIVLECFTLVGQALGEQTISYTYMNNLGFKPYIVRASSESFKGVQGFGSVQQKTGESTNGALTANSATGELLSVATTARSANISSTSWTDRFIKNSVTPRISMGEQAGATSVNLTMTNNLTVWGIGAVRVMEVSTEPPPPPPTPPSLPAVPSNPLGSVMMALPGLYTPSPDVTVYAETGTAPSYASPTTFAWDTGAAKFRIGGTLTLSDNNGMQTGVNNVSGQSTATNPLTAGLTSFEVEFWNVTQDLTIKFRSFDISDYLILVDDKPVTTTWQRFAATGYRYVRLVFSDDIPHRIRVLNGCNGFSGVIVPGGGDIQPAGARPRLAVTGDSYVQGAGGLAHGGPVMAGGMCGQLALLLGMEVWNLGQGTTGYIQEGTGASRSRFGSAARLAKLDARTYDAILVFGGGNDTNETPSNVVTNYATPMWNAIAAAHPSAKLIVAGIQSPDLFSATAMTALNDALRTAALANGNVDLWIDMRTPEYWVTDQTEDLFIVGEFPAAIHPGGAGSVNLAMRIVHAIAQAWI